MIEIQNVLIILFAAVLGACLGSFANVLAIRLHEMSSLLGRSRCPACDKPIRPRHLVPVFSWLALRGRCADCGAKIHVQYPLVEAACALLTVVAAFRHPPFGPYFPFFIVETSLAVILVAIVVMDLRWKELPLELMIIVGAVAAVIRLSLASTEGIALPDAMLRMFLAVLLGVVFFGVQWAISRGRWLGSGDVWFGAMMGLVLGAWQRTAIAIYLAYIIGGTAVAALLPIGKARKGMRVPFAPALALGLMSAWWFGAAIEARLAYAFRT